MGLRKSIVLVTVDCLRADHVGFMGYPRPVTPFLDSLAQDGVVFSDAIVTGAPTYFSLPGIFASRYPLSLGREILGIAPGEPTLTTALHATGAKTAAFLAGNPYLSPRFGYEQGFDRFKDFLDAAIPEESVLATSPENQSLSSWNRRIETLSHKTPLTTAAYDELYFWYCQWVAGRQELAMDQLRRYPAADVVMDQACSWLRDLGDSHFFLWVHLMDPHNPYFPPQEALSALGDTELTARRARVVNAFWRRSDVGPQRMQRYREEIVSLYDAGVYWVDKQISRLVDALQQLQRWDETVLVVTADHGEEFLEHGARYHSPENLPEQLIHVPLLLRAPGLAGARISRRPFSLIHLAPTLLEAVGVAVPDSFQGRSCWEQISAGSLPDEPAIAESAGEGANPLRRDDAIRPRVLAVRDSRFKLIIRFGEKTDYLYDLKSDPGEKSPIPSSTLVGDRARLLRVAHAHLQKIRQNRNADFVLDARLREIKQSIATKCG
jgi:arylsulfatase A-like enzyme